MKTIFFLSILLSLVFGDKLFIYPQDQTRIIQTVPIKNNTITNLPKTIDITSLMFIKPQNIQEFSYERETQPTLWQIQHHFLNKTVEYNNKKVILRELEDTHALIQEDKKLYLVDTKALVFPYMPKLLYKNATLKIKKPTKLPNKATISYLFRGIDSSVIYNLVLKNDKTAFLEGSFYIYNNTQQDIKVDSIDFITQKAPKRHPRVMYKAVSKMMLNDDAPSFSSKEHQTYQTYHYKNAVTLPKKQLFVCSFTKQKLPYTKHFSAKMSNPIYFQSTQTITPEVSIKLQPKQTLPQGKVQIFQNNTFLNTTTIKATPKKKKITLFLGKDLFSTVKQTALEYERNKQTYFTKIKYTLTNKGNKARTINVEIPYTINKKHSISTQQHFNKKDAHKVVFAIDMQPKSTSSFVVTFQGTF